MNKPETFKQDNPRDQLIVLIGALEGGLDNIELGISVDIKNLLQIVNELRYFTLYLPEEWDGNQNLDW
jgi:hypothetical protein